MKKLLSFLLTLTLFASIVTISSFAFDIPANSNPAQLKRMKHIAIPIMLLEILSIMAVRTILIQRVS